MIEKTCILVKPDGVNKKVVGKVLDRLESEGFNLLSLKMIYPDKELIESFYSVHKGKFFYESFIQFMVSGPIIATAWQGENAIVRTRKIIGSTDCQKAEPGTLRKLYGTDTRENLVHGSDSVESANREISIMFKTTELSRI